MSTIWAHNCPFVRPFLCPSLHHQVVLQWCGAPRQVASSSHPRCPVSGDSERLSPSPWHRCASLWPPSVSSAFPGASQSFWRPAPGPSCTVDTWEVKKRRVTWWPVNSTLFKRLVVFLCDSGRRTGSVHLCSCVRSYCALQMIGCLKIPNLIFFF